MAENIGNNFENMNFDIPTELLDEIQKNIEEIIENFDVPEDNKIDVIKKINFMYSHTKHMSETDILTGLYNRRNFDTNLEREFFRSKRYHSELSIAIIDIDFFKKINDTYGHLCGDYVLKEIAYMISSAFRKTDMVFRYGGEEFVAILTETGSDNAEIPLERLRKTIENYDFCYKNQHLKITISIGLSGNSDKINSVEEFLEQADKALYKAKNQGRNRLVISKFPS